MDHVQRQALAWRLMEMNKPLIENESR
jgi:hypothetical protein